MTRFSTSLFTLGALLLGIAGIVWLGGPYLADTSFPVPATVACLRLLGMLLPTLALGWLGVVGFATGRGAAKVLASLAVLIVAVLLVIAHLLNVQVPSRVLSAVLITTILMIPIAVGYIAAMVHADEAARHGRGPAMLGLVAGAVLTGLALIGSGAALGMRFPTADLVVAVAAPLVIAFFAAVVTRSWLSVTMGVMLGLLMVLLLEVANTSPVAVDRGQAVLVLIVLPFALPFVAGMAKLGQKVKASAPV